MLLCLLFTRLARRHRDGAGRARVLVDPAGARARSGLQAREPDRRRAGRRRDCRSPALIGLSPLLERITPEQLGLSGEGRIALSAATLRAAIEFLPFGSGLSTFADVFPRFQVEVFGGYIDHAHNDYLQFFMEMGLAAPVIVALVLAAYVTRMSELLRRDAARSFTVLQIAAGVGAAADDPAQHVRFRPAHAGQRDVVRHAGRRDVPPGGRRRAAGGQAWTAAADGPPQPAAS